MTAILGLDTSSDISLAAPALKAAGYAWIGRYCINPADTHIPGKALTKTEAQAISDAGLSLVSIYETNPVSEWYFTEDQAIYDANAAASVGYKLFDMLLTCPVYFAVDCDVQPEVVLQYFQELYNQFGKKIGPPIGVYGSGSVCQALLDAGLVSYTWLAQSTGWAGWEAFKPKATIIQGPQHAILLQERPSTVFPSSTSTATHMYADIDTAQAENYGAWHLPSQVTV